MTTEPIQGCADCGEALGALNDRGLCHGCELFAAEVDRGEPGLHILAVDLSALYWTAWHASGDEEISSAYTRTLRQIKDASQHFDRVAICVDSPRRERKELYPGYKAQRPPKPAGAIEQYKRTLEALGQRWPLFEADGHEGDDVIASLASWANGLATTGRDVQVTILGADKDLYQLLGPVVSLKSHQTGERFTADSLMAKAGITPSQVPCYLALCGDKADNLPGVDKCGAVMARTLLERFGNLEGIYDAVENRIMEVRDLPRVGPALIGALIEAKRRTPSVFEVRELVRLRVLDLNFDGLLEAPAVNDSEDGWDEGEEEDMSETNDSNPGEIHEGVIEAPDSAPRATVAATKQRADDGLEGDEPQVGTVALVRRDVTYERQLEPRSGKGAWVLAEKLFGSGLFKVRNTEQAFALILAGRSYGLDAIQSLRSVHIIEGKPSTSAAMMHALCLRHPQCEYFYCVEQSSRVATFETKRRGAPGATKLSWTIEEAQAAGLTGKDNWRKYPRAMLRARCIAELARTVYPDAVHNTYLADELGEDVVEAA